jgi:F-type H+-transporting ATPase subunit delta
MKQKVIAERYAAALFGLAHDLNKADEFGATLHSVCDLVNSNPELKRILQHPVIKKNDKRSTFTQLFEAKIPAEMLNFLYLLVDKKRENYLSEIAAEYQRLLNQLHKKVVTEVITAVPLIKKTEVLLKQELEDYLGQSVEMRCETDPSLLGGVRIKIGDRMIDGSLKTQLAGLAQSLV